jgi:hypothetical protein
MATYTNVVEDPEDFLIDFTADVCIPMLSNAESKFKLIVYYLTLSSSLNRWLQDLCVFIFHPIHFGTNTAPFGTRRIR